MALINRVATAMWMRLHREDGQTFVEYAVITAVVALGAIALLGLFTGDLGTAFGKIGTALKNAMP